MKNIAKIGLLLFLSGLFLNWGCAKSIGNCNIDRNCPSGQFCVSGSCQTSVPLDETVKKDAATVETKERVSEHTMDMHEKTVEQKPEILVEKVVETKKECEEDSDCSASSKGKQCLENHCVPGRVEIDFTLGHYLIGLDSKTCTASSQCESWRNTCTSGYCRLPSNAINTKVTIKVKIEDKFFLFTFGPSGSGAYSHPLEIDGKKYIRTKIVGVQSDKLQYHIDIDIPEEQFKAGDFVPNGKDIRIELYELSSEFIPARRFVLAYAVGGKVTFSEAPTTLGRRVSGTASLAMKLVP